MLTTKATSLQNVFVHGEYYHHVVDSRAGVTATSDNRQGGAPGPVLNFDGGLEASYSFGGKRLYDPTRSAQAGVIPALPLAPGKPPGWGAFELAGRFSIVNLNSEPDDRQA
jgi:hypothetical protein